MKDDKTAALEARVAELEARLAGAQHEARTYRDMLLKTAIAHDVEIEAEPAADLASWDVEGDGGDRLMVSRWLAHGYIMLTASRRDRSVSVSITRPVSMTPDDVRGLSAALALCEAHARGGGE